jgi:hypothetical protein
MTFESPVPSCEGPGLPSHRVSVAFCDRSVASCERAASKNNELRGYPVASSEQTNIE